MPRREDRRRNGHTRGTIPRRPGDPAGKFTALPFHGWYECHRCSGVVVDWAVHAERCNDDEPKEAEGYDLEAAVTKARELGNATVEFTGPHPHPWRQAWREVAACLRLFPSKDPRPAATHPPAAGRADTPGGPDHPAPDPAARAAAWARMAPMIERTTADGGRWEV